MAETYPVNSKPEQRRYFWMTLGALGLAVLAVVLVIIAVILPQGDGNVSTLLILVAMVVLFVGLVMVIISLVKMRHKVFPIIVLLALAIPFLGIVCCGGGGLLVVYGVDFLQGNNPILAPKPKVEWDTSPNTIVAQAAQPIKEYHASIPPDLTRNYIPEARLWGNGRIVLSSCDGAGYPRTVYEGRLTSEQMTAFLKQAVDDGFFGWKDNYFSLLPYDNPSTTYLTINLLTVKKTVSSSMGSAPRAFDILVNTLTDRTNVDVTLYKPTQGTLIAIPTTDEAKINWDTEKLNLDLSKAAQGIPVEGKTLQLAWDVVNQNPYYPPPVSLNGVNYTLYVIIPGLMY